MTLADVKGTVPLSAGSFSILTDAGKIVHPKVTVKGGGALPATLHSGQHINLDVAAGVTEGSGSIRWAPLGQASPGRLDLSGWSSTEGLRAPRWAPSPQIPSLPGGASKSSAGITATIPVRVDRQVGAVVVRADLIEGDRLG